MFHRGFLVLLINFFCLLVYSQTLEISGGYLLNHLYDTQEESPHWRTDYTNGGGYSIVLAVEDIKISGSLYISPQYSYYLGLSEEFRDYPEDQIRSMRHYFGLGIEKRLGKKTDDK